MTAEGGILTGIIEHNSAIYSKSGFDVEDVLEYHTAHKTLAGYKKAEKEEIDNPASFMEIPCDVLIPAAIEKSINMTNADRIKCKILAEAANGPTTFGADEILNKNGVKIIPDLLLNAGGVTVSYFEWLKNLQHQDMGRLSKRWEEQSKINLMRTLGYEINFDGKGF